MHVAGDDGRADVGGVVVADVENEVAFMLMRADQLHGQRRMIGQIGEGHDALAGTEVLARMARSCGRRGGLKLLAIDGAVEHLQVEGVVREDRQLGDGVGDAFVGFFKVASRRYCLWVSLSTWYGMSLVRAIAWLPMFRAWARIVAIKVSAPANFLA